VREVPSGQRYALLIVTARSYQHLHEPRSANTFLQRRSVAHWPNSLRRAREDVLAHTQVFDVLITCRDVCLEHVEPPLLGLIQHAAFVLGSVEQRL
jgi:hypothetical protein